MGDEWKGDGEDVVASFNQLHFVLTVVRLEVSWLDAGGRWRGEVRL